jgi:hypothetical protein
VAHEVENYAGAIATADASATILDGPDATRSAQSQADGSFRLTDVKQGGFTLRVRHDGYDSFFQGIRLTADTVLDIRLRRAQQSRSGTWTGTLAYDNGSTESIPEVTLVQDGAMLTPFRNPGAPFVPGHMFSFSGTLRDLSAIGSTTEISGSFDLAKVRSAT